MPERGCRFRFCVYLVRKTAEPPTAPDGFPSCFQFGGDVGFMSYSVPRDVVEAGTQVFIHYVDGERVYVKKRRPNKNPVGWIAQKLLYGITGNLLAMPPSRPEGDNVAFESGVLRRLAEQGVRVPRVLHVDKDYFVMSDAGPTLEIALRQEPEKAGEYIAKAVRELRRFHDLGFAHGGAQIKNITIKDGVIHFIDFEENIPSEHLEQFQIRDLFLLLLSLQRHGHDPDLAAICGLYDPDGESRILDKARAALRSLRIVRLLDSRLFSRLSMRDVRSLNQLIRKAEEA